MTPFDNDQWTHLSAYEPQTQWQTRTGLEYTAHGLARKTQRGFQSGDVEFLIRHGQEVGGGAYILLHRDAEALIAHYDRDIRRVRGWMQKSSGEDFTRYCRAVLRDRQDSIHRAERLSGVKVVVAGDKIVTAYDTTPRHQRRALRWGREAGSRAV